MRIRLEGDRRERLRGALRHFFHRQFDSEISDFQAEQLIDFFVHALGAPVYNQAIRDAQGFVQDKLTDLEGEFYEPEEPEPR